MSHDGGSGGHSGHSGGHSGHSGGHSGRHSGGWHGSHGTGGTGHGDGSGDFGYIGSSTNSGAGKGFLRELINGIGWLVVILVAYLVIRFLM